MNHRKKSVGTAGLCVCCCLVFLFGGCAAPVRNDNLIEQLTGQVQDLGDKLALSQKDNASLRKELILFKKSEHIDSERFLQAYDIFEKEFEPLIASQDLEAVLTDRGLSIVVLSENLFISGSNSLSEAGKILLDRICGLIEENFPGHYLYVEGHTDNQSLAIFEWKSDWDFSFARALSVLKYLTEKRGLDPLRLSASGFGQYRPRSSNDTKEGRRLNRRIEIVVSTGMSGLSR